MREITIKDKTIYIDNKMVNVSWSEEAAVDLKMFPEIDLYQEITNALIMELDKIFTLTKEEITEYNKVIKEHLLG